MYESAHEAGQLPAGFPSVSIVNTDPFNLSSFALSLLLEGWELAPSQVQKLFQNCTRQIP